MMTLLINERTSCHLERLNRLDLDQGFVGRDRPRPSSSSRRDGAGRGRYKFQTLGTRTGRGRGEDATRTT